MNQAIMAFVNYLRVPIESNDAISSMKPLEPTLWTLSIIKNVGYVGCFTIAAVALLLPTVMFPNLGWGWTLCLPVLGFAMAWGFVRPRVWLGVGTGCALGGYCAIRLGAVLWPIRDYIAVPLLPIAAAFNFIVFGAAGSLFAYLGRRLRSTRGSKYVRLAVALSLFTICLSLSLAAITGPIVRWRIEANEGAAIQRITLLHHAAILCAFDKEGGKSGYNWNCLEREYSGPPFSSLSWQRMSGNAVFEDGYHFLISLLPAGRPGFVIEASPIEREQTGNREFCIDQSGVVGCPANTGTWVKACIPCQK